MSAAQHGAQPLPRLLILTSTFPRWPGDHEPPFVFELARRLTGQFDVTVLAPHAPGAKRRECMAGVAVERFRYAPARLERLAYGGGISNKLSRTPLLLTLLPIFFLAQWVDTCRLVRRQRPSVVHAHWLITSGLVALLARRLCRLPFRVVVTAHGADIYRLQHPILLRLKRWIVDRCDLVTAVSPSLAQQILRLGAKPERVVVQAMGTDLQTLFVPGHRPEGPATVIYAGRLVTKKGVDMLLRACARLLPEVPDLQIIIAGHGPETAALSRLAEDLEISDRVLMSGPYRLHELPALYHRASVAVFPFRIADDGDQDGLGLAVVEAMGCQVPVITSRLPALSELVEDGVTGQTTPVDDPESLARCILESLRNPAEAHTRALAARNRVARDYGWPSIAARYAALLRGDINDAAAPRRRASN